ncbi:MAG: P-loop NTPase [Phycisphaerales bacterium]
MTPVASMSRLGVLPGDQAARLRAIVAPVAARMAPSRLRIVTVSSGKGGVGKTSIAVNLAIVFARAGKRAMLLDADLGMANADVLCGLTPARRLDQTRSLRGAGEQHAISLADIAIDAPGGFKLIPGAAGVARVADLRPEERLRFVRGLEELDQHADILIVDTGAGLGAEILMLMSLAHVAIVVATPEPTSVADAYALIKCASLADAALRECGSLNLVINEAKDGKEATAVHARIASVAHRFLGFQPGMLGWLPVDREVGLAVRRRRPLLVDDSKSLFSKGLQNIGAGLSKRFWSSGAEVKSERPHGIWARLGLCRS